MCENGEWLFVTSSLSMIRRQYRSNKLVNKQLIKYVASYKYLRTMVNKNWDHMRNIWLFNKFGRSTKTRFYAILWLPSMKTVKIRFHRCYYLFVHKNRLLRMKILWISKSLRSQIHTTPWSFVLIHNDSIIHHGETTHKGLFILSKPLQMLPRKWQTNVFLFHF